MDTRVTAADTAVWVAWHRALEGQRPDPLFRDPFAAKMAGSRGEEVARFMNRGDPTRGAWTTAVRTWLIDELLMRSLQQGVDRVIDLAAGYDTRPYRLRLPRGVRWVEIDAPAVLERKNELLEGATAGCPVERLPADLRQQSARAAVLERAVAGASQALVLTEGFLVYLSQDTVRGLAGELHAHDCVRFWITDLASPLVRWGMRMVAGRMTEDARWRFTPAEGIDFFEQLDWHPKDVQPVLPEARRLKRLSWPVRLISLLERNPRRPWGAVLRLESR